MAFSIGRRGLLLAGGATLVAPRVLAQAKPKVVIIGGGPAGATLAKYLSKDAEHPIDVTLVNESRNYFTCFTSNLVLANLKTFESLDYSYAAQIARGVHFVQARATRIERDKQSVQLSNGQSLPYDRLIVAPGIDFKWDFLDGYSEAASEVLPHAWRGAKQMQLLKDQLEAVPDGGTIVLTAPADPYRCPPAPYERVSMMAARLKAKGHKTTRIVILDAKEHFSKQPLFNEAWEKHYTGMVEWQAPSMHGGLKRVDAKAKTIETGLETIKADLINIIPPQKAGAIAVEAGLADATGFCPADAVSFISPIDSRIHVLGDSAIAGDMPKSAFAANNQAKTVAMEIRAAYFKTRLIPVRYTSTCWSTLAEGDTVKNGGRYEPKDGRITALETFVSQLDEAPAMRKRQYEEATGWYRAMTTDIFGS